LNFVQSEVDAMRRFKMTKAPSLHEDGWRFHGTICSLVVSPC
jgi:hypothetical protein